MSDRSPCSATKRRASPTDRKVMGMGAAQVHRPNAGGSDEPRPDVAALPDLLHGHAGAGPVRTHRPVYLDLLPPCNAGCPAGENIQAWLAHMQAGRHEQAWRELV